MDLTDCTSLLVAASKEISTKGMGVEYLGIKDRDTALQKASASGDVAVVDMLLKAGANPSTTNMKGDAPLHMASAKGHKLIVDMLLKAGASLSAINECKDTPLLKASVGGHELIVDVLLNAGANPNAVNKYMDTPLHLASADGRESIVNILLKAGASPSAHDKYRNTPLHRASANGHNVIVDALLMAGANPSALNMSGDTPFHKAAANGHKVVVESLLKSGADPSIVNQIGDTPIHKASVNGHKSVVQLLLKAGADPSVANENGNTPLHEATVNGHEKVVHMLLKAGALPSAMNKCKDTPLHNASTNGYEVIVDMLLKAGADPFAANEYKYTPLHRASSNGHDVIVDLLLKADASPSATNVNGDTPLHEASANENVTIVEMLLKAGADPSAVNELKNTSLHMASANGRQSILEVLIRFGGDIKMENRDGYTPLQLLTDFEERKAIKKFVKNEKKRKEGAIGLFKKQCQKDGSVEMLVIKCILSGLPRVGKTSFLKRINKKIIPSKSHSKGNVIPSTGFEAALTINIAEEDTTIGSVAIKRGQWVPTSKIIEQGRILLSSISQSCKSKNKMQINEGPSHISGSNSSLQNLVTDVTEDLPKATKKKLSTRKKRLTSATSLIEKAASQNIDDQFQNGGRVAAVYFIDTGGQPEFHELLPPLLHGPAFHLLFFNAFNSLFEPVEVVYRHDDTATSSIKYTTTCSSIEIIHQLLVSFFGISRSNKYKSVAALFGSHVDMYTGADKRCSMDLQHVSDSLEKQFIDATFFQQQFLVLPNSEDCPYWFQPIDNITCSEEELEKIQNFLFDVMQNRFPPVSLPVTWATFHLTLRDKYEKSSGVCAMKECISLAEDCHIPSEHVPYVLEFLHYNLGTILYYPEIKSLNDYVIVNPNVLFRGISSLVTVSFIGSGPQQKAVHTIRETGEIPVNIITLDQPLSESCPLTNQHVVDLLVHFKLLHIFNESYFMPCLLMPDPTVAPSLISMEVLGISPPPLLILFEDGFVPVGLFSGVVNELSTKWKLDKENRFRNRVNFIVPPGHFELRQCLKYIEVRAYEISCICPEIRKTVCISLNEVINVQPHLNNTKFKFGFYCPDSHMSGYPHPCEYNDDNIPALICCKRSRCFDCKLLPSMCFQWFKCQTSFVKEACSSSPLKNHPENSQEQIPYKVFQKHFSSLVKLISDPIMLANELWSAELVSSPVKEDVLTSRYLSVTHQSSLLLNDFSKSLLIPKEDQVAFLEKFCKVLHNQDTPGLSRIANQLLHEIKLE